MSNDGKVERVREREIKTNKERNKDTNRYTSTDRLGPNNNNTLIKHCLKSEKLSFLPKSINSLLKQY